MNELQGKRILFFVPGVNAETHAIMVSQILGLARYAVTLGAECAVFHVNENRSERVYDLEPHIRMINHWRHRVKSNLLNVVKVFGELTREYECEIRDFSPTHVYTRSCFTCLGVKAIAREVGAKVIFSVRGPVAEEQRRSGGVVNLFRSWIVAHYENRGMLECDVLSTLSHAYREFLETRYLRQVIGVIPCCVEARFFNQITPERREKLRSDFGFDSTNRVVIWQGSFAHWQRLDDVVELLKGICERDPSYRAMFLVNQPEKLTRLCERHAFDKSFWRTKCCRPNEMPEHVQMADMALNLQHPGTLHSRTCSPVKIPEYLASGLPVCVSRVMGDMPVVMERERVGCQLPDDLDVEQTYGIFESLRNFDSSLAREKAKQLFTWEGNESEVVKLFQT